MRLGFVSYEVFWASVERCKARFERRGGTLEELLRRYPIPRAYTSYFIERRGLWGSRVIYGRAYGIIAHVSSEERRIITDAEARSGVVFFEKDLRFSKAAIVTTMHGHCGD